MNETCPNHLEMYNKIKELEVDVSKLQDRWDNIQKLLIGTLVSISLNLMGIIFLLLRGLENAPF